MKKYLLFIVLLALGGLNVYGQNQLITNGNFTSSSGWITSGNWYITTTKTCYNNSSGYAYAGDASGYAVNNETGDLKQTVTIPSTATSATLTFYASKSTDEVTTTEVFDYVNVLLLNSSGSQLMQFSPTNINNLYAGKPSTLCDGYSVKSFSIPTTYFGQQVQVVFRVHTDGAKYTMFRIDDVSLTYIASTTCIYSISTSSISPSYSSGNGSVSVTATSGCNWTAVSNNTSWLTVTSGSSGTGNGTVGYSYTTNSSSSPRTGTITIAGKTFTVTQAGSSCSYSISPSSVSPSSSTGSGSISVTATSGCSWTAVSNNTSWLTVTSGSSGTGNGTVGYSYTTNSSSSPKTGTITIAEKTFTVTQAGSVSCSYSISPSSVSPSSSSGSGSVSVTATSGCSWTAASNNTSWLTVTSGSSGTGNGTVGYSYITNSSSSPRTGTITIAGSTFTVTQSGTNTSGLIHGVDISAANGTVSWSQVYSTNHSFAYIKASEGVNSPSSVTTYFNSAITRSNPNNVVLGAYHFARPDFSTNNTAANEAQGFWTNAGNYTGNGFLPPVLDMDSAPVEAYLASGHTKAQLAQWVNEWCTQIYNLTNPHKWPILYIDRCRANYLVPYYQNTINSNIKLWIAAYETAGSPSGSTVCGSNWNTWPWVFHQYYAPANAGANPTEFTNPGIDQDVFNGDQTAFNNLIGGSSPPIATTTITNISFPSTVNFGETFNLTYTISATGNMNVLLGASIRRNNLDYSDAANDKATTLSSGSNSKPRSFNLSATTPNSPPAGVYDVIVALWSDKNGNGVIDTGDSQLDSYTITQGLTINAITNYTISTSSNPSSGGTTNGGGSHQSGSSRTVTATANNGYTFSNWTENGSQISANSSYTFTLSGNRTLVANFITSYSCTTPSSPSTCTTSIGDPANGLVHTSNLSCNIVPDAEGYFFEYSVDGITWNTSWGPISWNEITIDHQDRPNVPRYYRVRAYKCDPVIYSNYTYATPQPIYTACDDPAIPIVNGATSNSLNITLNAETPVENPSYTTYSVYCTTTSQYVQTNGALGSNEVFQTKSEWGTKSVTGLLSNKQYCFYAKARNSSGDIRFNATNNNCATTLTSPAPAAPIATAATNITPNSFSANWSTSATATGYRLDVALDNAFANFVSGYNNKDVGNVTTSSVTGLTANTPYYYRLRAYNSAGISSNSNAINVTTLTGTVTPLSPTAIAATSITQNNFSANWYSSATATGYRLDVALDNAFTSFVTGYNNKDVGNMTSSSVTGLNAGTLYYYRLRAYNSAGTSGNSNTINVTTLTGTVIPLAPAAIAATSITQNSFSANWHSSATATGYLLDVALDNAFTNLVTGYNNKDVGNVTNSAITGLNSNISYYYRVKAYNSVGSSGISNTITVTTSAPLKRATLSLGNINGATGTNVSIPVSAIDFTDVVGFQFTIVYDKTKLDFVNCTNWFTGINPSNVQINTLDGKLTFVYTDVALNIANGKFFDLNFTIKANATGTAALSWSDTPTLREISNSQAKEVPCNYYDGILTIATGINLSGQLIYENTAQTPLNKISLSLLNTNNQSVATATTDETGNFLFPGISNGNYSIKPDLKIAWGGVTAIDITSYKKHIGNITTLSQHQVKSGDINGSNSLTSMDLTVIKQRIGALISSFTVGDWVFDQTAIVVNGLNIAQNIKALCYGDANGSYLPSTLKSSSNMFFANNEKINLLNNGEFGMPFKLNKSVSKLSSVTLLINYPAELFDVKDIKMIAHNEDLYYSVKGGIITVVYSTLNSLDLNEGDLLMTIQFSLKKDASMLMLQNNQLEFYGTGEFGDYDGKVIEQVKLSYATSNYTTLVNELGKELIKVYPNPASNTLTVTNVSNTRMNVIDMLGRSLLSIDCKSNTTELDIHSLVPGTYTLKIDKNSKISYRKFTVVK